jgi:hypothetical protein
MRWWITANRARTIARPRKEEASGRSSRTGQRLRRLIPKPAGGRLAESSADLVARHRGFDSFRSALIGELGIGAHLADAWQPDFRADIEGVTETKPEERKSNE